MSTHAVQPVRPVRQFSVQSILVWLAGAVLAVAAGFGIALLVLDDEPVATAPTVVEQRGPSSGLSDVDNQREARELMHRR